MIYFMAKASVQQLQSSLVLQPSTFVWNDSIFALQSSDTDVSMTMSAQLSSMLALQFFRVSPEAEADLRTFEKISKAIKGCVRLSVITVSESHPVQ